MGLKMLTRTVAKSVLETRIPSTALPPTFLLPIRARFFNSTTQHIKPSSDIVDVSPEPSASSKLLATQNLSVARSRIPSPPSPPAAPLQITQSIRELLPLLVSQPSHYISAHIHGKPYLVTQGDMVRLPFLMPGVIPGDVLRLNRASILGSRDFTLKGAPYLDERLFECRARVMGTEAEPMRLKVKKKQRNRRTKTVRSKHKFTILRIAELKVNPLEDLEGEWN